MWKENWDKKRHETSLRNLKAFAKWLSKLPTGTFITVFTANSGKSKHQGGPGSVRLRFGGGTVRAIPVFGSGGYSARRVFLCFTTV